MKYLIIITLLVSPFVNANKNNDFDMFIKNFYDDFSQRKLKKISEEVFHQDAQFIFGEHIMVPGSAIELEAVFISIIASLEKDGYKKSVVRHINTNYTGNNYVVSTIFFDRYKNNNEKLDSMCSTYSAVKLAGGWKILTWLPTKPQESDSCFKQ